MLRQQQLQRQQEQNSSYEQQQRVTTQQISPSAQHRSTAGFGGGQPYQQVSPNQQGRSRAELEQRQRQDEQGFLLEIFQKTFLIDLFRLSCSSTSNSCSKRPTTTRTTFTSRWNSSINSSHIFFYFSIKILFAS